MLNAFPWFPDLRWHWPQSGSLSADADSNSLFSSPLENSGVRRALLTIPTPPISPKNLSSPQAVNWSLNSSWSSDQDALYPESHYSKYRMPPPTNQSNPVFSVCFCSSKSGRSRRPSTSQCCTTSANPKPPSQSAKIYRQYTAFAVWDQNWWVHCSISTSSKGFVVALLSLIGRNIH